MDSSFKVPTVAIALAGWVLSATVAAGAAAEWNPVRHRPMSLGPEAHRLIVGFRATIGNAQVERLQVKGGAKLEIRQARTTPEDVAALTQRTHVGVSASRQITPSMHVLFMPRTLYGAQVDAVLAALRADPAVKFADVDQRRFAHAETPDDPLFGSSANATGQWFMQTPSPSGDASATDAVSAWSITLGATGVVIADIDTGVRFDHPDLLRTGFLGRLLPGYDFVGEDYDPNTGAALGTFLTANDGDGWDPDPSDPGDWIDATDQTMAVFKPPAPATCDVQSSSWHGTRVMGILGALTNNGVGVAGMTWNNDLLPVRALGKCGGYDSDIIAGMQWAAGLAVTDPANPGSTIPGNPYPAQIINLSLGGSGACPSAYADAVTTLTGMGVLIVASAGNESGPVDAPANCAGVLGVAGLRNVGTKVGYSSFGAEVSVAAPAGNCINSSGACLRSIDTTVNTGTTVPADNTYTDQLNPNLGTSFSSPIVAGIAGLMRAVNGNLTPAQLIARIKASASPFPQPAALVAAGYVCPTVAPTTAPNAGECACPNDGSECGAGMVNAYAAVEAALRPIAAVKAPPTGSTVLDATGSAAACPSPGQPSSNPTIAAYAWSATPSALIPPNSTAPTVTLTPNGTAGTVTLTVTDSAGATDTAVIQVSAAGAITVPATTPASAGAAACPAAFSFAAAPPTVTPAFAPASVGENGVSTLTFTLANSNAFALTQADLTVNVPSGLSMAESSATVPAPATTCGGGTAALSSTAASVALIGAYVPAGGSCTLTLPVKTATAGSYTSTVAAGALTTGSAGTNASSSSALLTVTAPSKGGGAVDWWDMMFAAGVLLAGRRHARRGPRRP